MSCFFSCSPKKPDESKYAIQREEEVSPYEEASKTSSKSVSGKTVAVVAGLALSLVGLAAIGAALGLKYSGRNISVPQFYTLIGVGSGAVASSLLALTILGVKQIPSPRDGRLANYYSQAT